MNLRLSIRLILIFPLIFLLPSRLSAELKEGFDIKVLPLHQKIIADGQKVYSLTFVVLDKYRRLLEKKDLFLISDLGSLSPVIEDPPGFYTSFLTPPEILETKLIKITAQAKVRGLKVTRAFKIRAYPYQGLSTPVSSSPDLVITGKVRKVKLNITVQDRVGQAIGDAKLTLESTVGNIAGIKNLGKGKYQATYVLPPGKYPQAAIITIKAESRGMTTMDMFMIPLVAEARIEGRTKPNSRVAMKAGKKELGTTDSGVGGEFELPLTIPPGYNYATLTVTDAFGNIRRKAMDLKIPKSKLMKMYITPEKLLADGNSRAEIRVFTIDRFGEPRKKAKVVITASTGEVSPVREEKPGVYVADYFTPAGLPGGERQKTVSLKAYIPGGGKVLTDSGKIKLWAGFLPAEMSLKVKPETLVADGLSHVAIRVELKDQTGNPVPGRPVKIRADLGQLSKIEDQGDGVYTAWLTSPKKRKKESIRIRASLRMRMGRDPKKYFFLEKERQIRLRTGKPAMISLEAAPPFLQADGISFSRVTTKIADANENPITGESLVINASRGRVVGVTDHGDGSYTFNYISSKERYEKIVRISVSNTQREFNKALSITLIPKPRNYSIGLKTGYINNFGKISTVFPGLEATYRLPVLNRMLFLSLESGWYRSTKTYKQSETAAGEDTIERELQVIPVSLNTFYKKITSSPFFTPYLGGGLGANITNSKISSSFQPTFVQKRTLFGIHCFGGIESRLGPGAGFLEVKYNYAKLKPEEEFGVKGNVGGLVAFLGYRWEL